VEPTPDEEKQEEEEEEDEVEVVEEPEVEEEPPKVTLTAEEKANPFRKTATPDVSAMVLSTNFPKFTVPSKDEGYDEIRYEWLKGSKCEEYVKQWIMTKKQTTRVEELQPSPWFASQKSKFDMALKDWKSKAQAYRTTVAQKEAAKRLKANEKIKKANIAKAAALKKEADKKKKKAEAEAAGKQYVEEVETEPVAVVDDDEEDEDEELDIAVETIDTFALDDVSDCGGKGVPLYKDFQNEDWTMLALRLELSLLVHAFKRDVGDPDRTGIVVEHLPFYYSKYYKKMLTPKGFGVESIEALVGLVIDSVHFTKGNVLETVLPDEFESYAIFVKLTEEARRYRSLLVDSGDDSARLKILGAGNNAGIPGEKSGGNWKAGDQAWGKGGGKWTPQWAAAPYRRW